MSYVSNPERQLNKDQLSGYAGLDASGNGKVGVTHLGDGSANSTTYLRGDQTWATPAAGSPVSPVGPVVPVIISGTSYTLLDSDYAILADCTGGDVEIDLPDASGNAGKVYVLKKIDASINALHYVGLGADTIDGDASGNITVQYDSITILSNSSTGWSII